MRVLNRIQIFFKALDRKSLAFFIILTLAYSSQIIFHREDWPLTKLSLFSAGRYDTHNTCKISVQYIDQGAMIDPLLLGSDKFFIVESLQEMICHRDSFDRAQVTHFIDQNITPILTRKNMGHSGVINLRLRFWDELVFGNFTSPNRDEIILRYPLQGSSQ